MLKTLNLLCEKYELNKYDVNLLLQNNDVKIPSDFCILPWTGNINPNVCQGLKHCGGLFIQCDKNLHDNKYCKTCSKQAEKNESGKPDAGTVEDRNSIGILDYVDSKGRKAISFTKYMKKNNITKESLIRVAELYDITIPEEQFVEKSKKNKEVLKNEDKEVKKRGRPKKEVRIVNETDIINSIEINTSEEKKEILDDTIKEMEEEKYIDDDNSDDDDPELDVSEIEIDGKTYYKADNNYLYNSDGDLQGYWNGKKIEIINKQ
jgi:hypothetical protein